MFRDPGFFRMFVFGVLFMCSYGSFLELGELGETCCVLFVYAQAVRIPA